MLKAAGAILILFSALYYGMAGYLRLKTRLNVMKDMTSALEIVKGEIKTKQMSVPDIICLLSRSTEGNVRQIFKNCEIRLSMIGEKTFFEIWKESIDEERSLTDDEKAIIADVGKVLGRYDVETQLLSIDRTCRELERATGAAKEKMKRSGISRAVIYAAAGLILVIILI